VSITKSNTNHSMTLYKIYNGTYRLLLDGRFFVKFSSYDWSTSDGELSTGFWTGTDADLSTIFSTSDNLFSTYDSEMTSSEIYNSNCKFLCTIPPFIRSPPLETCPLIKPNFRCTDILVNTSKISLSREAIIYYTEHCQ
jgi:hypothetical protein